MADKLTRTNQSADKIFDVVETMVLNGSPMRLNDIAKQCNIPQSTAFRMINALRERGYVVQDNVTSLYSLSLKFTLIGDMIRAKFDLRDLVHPYMQTIATEGNGICYLGVPRQHEMVYIDMVSPPGSVLTRMPFIGRHVPMHCSGIGLVLLSSFSDEQLEQYFDQIDSNPAPRDIRDNTLDDPADIRRRVKDVRTQGYSFATDRLEHGNGSIAVGLRNYSGRIIAGLSLGAPVSRLTDDYVQHALSILRPAADKISSQLAYDAL